MIRIRGKGKMKPGRAARYMMVLALGFFLLTGGCASTLKLEKEVPKLAEHVGIDPSEVKFTSYCGFVETTREDAAGPEHRTLAAMRGVVLLTDTHLYVLRNDAGVESAKDEIRMPYSRVSGAALALWRNASEKLIAYQIQLIGAEHVLVVQIGPGSGRDDEIPLSEAQRPFDLILAAGVPRWENEKFLALDMPSGLDFKTACATALGVLLAILIQALMTALIVAPIGVR